MNLSIIIDRDFVYFYLFFKTKKIWKKKEQIKENNPIKTIFSFLSDFLSNEKKVFLQIVTQQNSPFAEKKQQEKFKKEIKNAFAIPCFFVTPITCLALASDYKNNKKDDNKLLLAVENSYLTGALVWKQKVIRSCAFANWNIGNTKEGNPIYLKEYLLKSPLKEKPQRYQEFLIKLVNLFDPHQIVFFQKKEKELKNSFFKKDVFFKNPLKTKIFIKLKDSAELALGAVLQEK